LIDTARDLLYVGLLDLPFVYLIRVLMLMERPPEALFLLLVWLNRVLELTGLWLTEKEFIVLDWIEEALKKDLFSCFIWTCFSRIDLRGTRETWTPLRLSDFWLFSITRLMVREWRGMQRVMFSRTSLGFGKQWDLLFEKTT
jgi:hypothetical protein